MTRDEAIELMAAGMYGKGWNGPIDKMPGEKMKNVWLGYCANAFDALIAAGWTGPGSANEVRNAALEEAAKVAKHMEAYGVAAAIRALKG